MTGAATEVPRPREVGGLEAFHESSWGWALACCLWNRDEAEDVLQTAYLKALDGRARFEGRASERTWFFAVIRRTAAERRRRGLVRRLALSRWASRRLDPGAAIATPEAVADDDRVAAGLRTLLLRLSPRQRALLHLVFYQELTVEQAAGVLGISVGSARTHYARGKARLRTMLASGGGGR